MRLVYSYNINNSNDLLRLCETSKDLYNEALWIIKTNLMNDKYVYYNELDNIMKAKINLDNEVTYRKLKAQVSQQILKLLDKNIKSYFKSIKDYSKNKSKYKGKPKLPNYKQKHNLLIYTNQCSTIKDGYIHLSKDLKIPIPQWDKYKGDLKSYNQIRIIPKLSYIKVEIIYEKEENNQELNYNEFSSIDLGLNNLITLVTSYNNPLIFSGKQIKSYNQYFNKHISKLKSIKDKQGIKQSTKQIKLLYDNRSNYINDIFHKVSRLIVNYLLHNKIGNLIIGYNEGWKDSINMGKKNNQSFVGVAHQKLIELLNYKCKLVGIKLTTVNESYTSKCDGLALEPVKKQEIYSGRRKKRGLFNSSVGKLINADVNGSINIMRKVIGDSYVKSRIIDSGLLFNPVKIKNLFEINFKSLLINLNKNE